MDLETRIENLKLKFLALSDEEKYFQVIEMGKKLSPLPPEKMVAENLVSGCQSKLYLISEICQNKIYFSAFSDALISLGLAALLIEVYQGETVPIFLKHEPIFLKEMGLLSSLSMNRSQGLLQIYSKMKKDVLNFLINNPSLFY